MPNQSSDRFAFPLDSEMWRVNHQRCGLFFGPAAAILQIAHPRIAQGVADHSNFESDSLGRLQRTLAATNRIAFGTLADAEAVKDRLRKVHQTVKGDTSPGMGGRPKYSAFEPDLLLWVLATMIVAARQGYELVYGPLAQDRREQFYREMRQFGNWFGLDEDFGPEDSEAFDSYYQEMIQGDLLGSHPLCAELARAIVAPKDSASALVIGKLIRFLPVETIPNPVRDRLGLPSSFSTRTSMRILRRSAPVLFPVLPRKLSWFPESIERMDWETENEVYAPLDRAANIIT